jgi:DNA helicase-2/ATP-dependent DNA helicase PcrA
MKKINYSQELNPAQLEAVQSLAGPHLVIAGAGSGKTRVLVYRVAYLVERGISPENILLLTFTRKAAGEMLRRAALLLDARCQRVSGGTFHSFASFLLRKYARAVNLSSSFTILDDADAEDVINLLRTQFGFNKLAKRFPRKKTILEVISKSINKVEVLKDVLFDEYPQFLEWEEDIKKIRQEYKKYKQLKSLLDYDDLLLYCRDLLEDNKEIRGKLSQRYRYIMVDEYQDTNKLQAHIAALLASEHKNIMVVGDDSQSIYSFRGANFRNIMDFPEIFKGTKIITLEENYRSTQPILDLTNEVLAAAAEKFEKVLFTRKPGQTQPVYVDCRDDHAQSRYVADKILELREQGIGLGEMVVLFRSGWHSNDLEIELASRNIPFVKYGGQKFVEAAHIKDMLAYLRISYNLFDAVSWYRALLLLRGIGPKTAERILQEVISNKKGLNVEDAILGKSEDLRQLFELLKKVDGRHLEPERLIEVFLKFYQPLLRDKYDDFNKRLNDLDSLLRIAARYDSLEYFLTDLALEPPERSIIEAGFKDKDDTRLCLSTIHSAKGLEWQTVFLIYAAEGHLPSYLSLEDEEAIEEERRLFYVACTRAKENLFILKPHIDRSPRSYLGEGASVFTQPSRFLTEGNILEKHVAIESVGELAPADELELEDILEDKPLRDQEFLKLMHEYYRSSEDI